MQYVLDKTIMKQLREQLELTPSTLDLNGSLTYEKPEKRKRKYDETDFKRDVLPCVIKLIKVDANLEELMLGSNNLYSSDIERLCIILQTNRTLKKLDLNNNNHFGTTGYQHIAQMLMTNEHLQDLKLSNGIMFDDGVTLIMEALVSNTALKYIDISSNKISPLDALRIHNMLLKNKHLASVNMEINYIGDGGATWIAEALEKNNSLKNIKLGWNNLLDDAAMAFAKMLRVNNSLEALNLKCNKFSAGAMQTFAEALKINTGLVELNVINAIDTEGAIHICEALKSNTTLKKLSLRANNIKGAAKSIASMLACNTLTEIDIAFCWFDATDVEHVCRAIETNTSLKTIDVECSKCATDELCRNALKANTTFISSDVDDGRRLATRNIRFQKYVREEKINLLLSLKKSDVIMPWHIQKQFFTFVTTAKYRLCPSDLRIWDE